MKKAIALFSTMMILVLVIMLMSVALKNTTNIKRATLQDRYLIQENLTVAEAIKLVETQIVAKLPKSGESRIELQQTLFSTPLTIQDSVTNSTITIQMKPNDGKMNINFLNSNDIQKYIITLFEKIGVKEPTLLSEILLANITNDEKYRDEYKIPLKQLDKSFGTIDSYEEFEEMLQLYAQETDDTEVFEIDFQKYFYFYAQSEIKYNIAGNCKIDINYTELEIVDALISLPNSTRTAVEEKTTIYTIPWDEESETVAQSILEDLKTSNILLKINISSINNKVEYELNYNLESKKISKISLDRWIY